MPIWIVAGILAACSGASPGATPPSIATSPTVTPGATAKPGPTASPAASSPTFAPLPSTIEGCPTVDAIVPDSPFVDATASLGRFGVDLQVTRIEERSGRQQWVTPPSRELNNGETGLMLGGHEFLISPSYYYEGYDPPITMEATSAVLTLDGGAPTALPVRFVPGNENFNQAAVSVPDVSGNGTVALELTWTDKCFRMTASGTARVRLVPTSVTAGCALGEEAYWQQLGGLFEHALSVASTDAHLTAPSSESKYGPYVNPGIDAFIVYGFDRDDPAITALPGSALRIENHNADLALSGTSLVVFTRHSVARAVKDYPPYGTVIVLSRTPAQQPDGSWRLRVPDEPGRYVATIAFAFESKCSTGTAWAVVNIDVPASATPPPT